MSLIDDLGLEAPATPVVKTKYGTDFSPAAVDARIAQAAAERAAREAEDAPLLALDVHELAKVKFKPREPILEPWLATQDLGMVFAPRGVGKTHFALALAYAVATGGTFAKWKAPRPRRVLYLDGELQGEVMQQRLLLHCPDAEPAPGFFRVFTPDLMPDGRGLPDLSTLDGQDAIESTLGDAEVVVIDNLSAWARSGRENEAESWTVMSDWLLSLRRRGIAVLLVHHAGKSGQQRGTSKREDVLDVVVSLSRPQDYEAAQGATFIAEFTKARHLSGTDAESIELQLTTDGDRATWTWRTVKASTYDRVIALAREGLRQNEIATELEVNKSTVSRHLRHARESGDLEGQP